MKEKIIKLLQGSGEDQLLAVEYLLENQDLIKDIFGWSENAYISNNYWKNRTNKHAKISLSLGILLLGVDTIRIYSGE